MTIKQSFIGGIKEAFLFSDGALTIPPITPPSSIYVGADNIGSTTADIRFSPSTTTGVNYKVYRNTSKANDLLEAEKGVEMASEADVDIVSITGLTDKTVYYISVVADNGNKLFLGSYGFVTGATLYWDATITQIAGATAGRWKNIASSGSAYDGVMSNANITNGYYSSTSPNSITTFKSMNNLRALFIDAHLNQFYLSGLMGHSSLYELHPDFASSSTKKLLSGGSSSVLVRRGNFFTDTTEHGAGQHTKFLRLNRRATYGLTTTGGVDVSQTRDRNISGRNWENGKYYRTIIFTKALTSAQALTINTFLTNTR